MKVWGAGPASTTMGATLLVVELPTVTVNVPDWVGSHCEVAVMVTDVGNDGAVNKPAVEICPALALQETAGLKLPWPVTVAVH
jgi:hypothetical protein